MSTTAKEFTLMLDGQPRKLLYTMDDREDIEEMFPGPDGTPANLGRLVANHVVSHGSFKVLATITWAGLRHLGNSWTLGKVKELLSKEVQNGNNLHKFVQPVAKAVMASGVLGKQYDVSDEEGKV